MGNAFYSRAGGARAKQSAVLDRRTKHAWLAGVSAATAGAAAAAWLCWLPNAVAARAQELLARRAGVPVHVGDASVGLSSVVVEDVRIGDVAAGVTVRVAAVRLSGGPFAWLVSGLSGVDTVEASGVEIEFDLSRPNAAQTLTRWRSSALAQSDGAARSSRSLSMDGVHLSVRDATGVLADVAQGFARRSRGRLVVGAGAVQLGGESGDVAMLRDVELELGRGERGALVTRVVVGGGKLVWASRVEAPDAVPAPASDAANSTARRMRAALALLGGELGRTSPAAAGTATEPAASGAAAAAESGASDAGAAEEPMQLTAAAADEGPLSRVAAHVAVVIGDLEVAVRGPDGEKTVLRGLDASLDGQGSGVFLAKGAGTGQPSGTVRWDVELRPAELRAAGSVGLEDVPLALLLPLLPNAPLYRPEDARIDAELVVRGDGLTRLALEGSVHVRDVAVSSARVAPEAVRGISFAVEGTGAFVPAERRLEITAARVAIGPDPSRAAVANVSGTLEWAPDHYLFDLLSTLPPTPCGAAVGAIPGDLLAELRGLSFAGTLSGRARVLVDSRNLDTTRVEVAVQDGCTFETVPALADLRRFEGPFLHHVVEPDGTTFEMETGPGTAQWTPIAQISPFLVHAVLAHEDGAFFRHHGFAPAEIQVALVRNLRAGRYVQGASTITMQLVKNLFLHREKTLARKVQEVLLTWWIERVLDKAHILELYLNVIEYGPAVYGIRNAAWHYFGRLPAELSPAESAFLATILPSPKAFDSVYLDGRLSPRLAERLRSFLRRMASRGRIDQAALDAGLAQVDTFGFHREGDAPPPPRALTGTAETLPFDLPETALDAWGDDPAAATAEDAAQWYDADGTERAPAPVE